MCCAFVRIIRTPVSILLEQNYRSTQTILDAANAVIANNHNRTPKTLAHGEWKGLDSDGL